MRITLAFTSATLILGAGFGVAATKYETGRAKRRALLLKYMSFDLLHKLAFDFDFYFSVCNSWIRGEAGGLLFIYSTLGNDQSPKREDSGVFHMGVRQIIGIEILPLPSIRLYGPHRRSRLRATR